MASLDPFGFHQDKDAHLLPLVDFCFDLTDHLEEGDIPSPIEFFKERDEIVSYLLAQHVIIAVTLATTPRPLHGYLA
ncbi:hypothetical protein BD413DRAFT_611858 [Trametes elegans]|nr:hypothetical protein BD413DRAFT_611858 [Trametes elegans]